jgi:excisionase family DNA binding protein
MELPLHTALSMPGEPLSMKWADPLMPTRTSEVLDVRMAAELLTVSLDTVYDLFKNGELPGRKVGRKWLTTRNALMRCCAGSRAQR